MGAKAPQTMCVLPAVSVALCLPEAGEETARMEGEMPCSFLFASWLQSCGPHSSNCFLPHQKQFFLVASSEMQLLVFPTLAKPASSHYFKSTSTHLLRALISNSKGLFLQTHRNQPQSSSTFSSQEVWVSVPLVPSSEFLCLNNLNFLLLFSQPWGW